jgi:hypothetical protein
MRNTLGTAVFSGMLGVTLFGILLTPVFFYSIDWLGESRIFASHTAHQIGNLSLAVLTLKPLRVAGSELLRQLGHRPTPSKRAFTKSKAVESPAESSESEIETTGPK